MSKRVMYYASLAHIRRRSLKRSAVLHDTVSAPAVSGEEPSCYRLIKSVLYSLCLSWHLFILVPTSEPRDCNAFLDIYLDFVSSLCFYTGHKNENRKLSRSTAVSDNV